MIIYSSNIIQNDTVSVIETVFETKGKEQKLWYEVSSDYKQFLVSENLDAAVVALLVLAMKNNEDIHVKGQLSAKLKYSLNTYLVKALVMSNPEFHEIEIHSDTLNTTAINVKNTAATGLSCGIDSISTIVSHLNIEEPHKIEYLTYFNAGSHGAFDGEIANKIYEKRLSNIENFANSIKLPLLKINTNLLDLLDVSFQSIHSIIHASCVLNFQKIFKTYYYASAFKFDYFKFDKNDTSSWDTLILSHLGTESTTFFSSMSQFSRLERTKLVAENAISYKYLDVCTDPLSTSKNNCSKCEKCLRTILSIEMIGDLNLFENVFDLSVYHKYRDEYIGRLILNKEYNQINQEIYNTLKGKDLIITKHYVLASKLKIRHKIKLLKKLFK